MSSGTKAAGTGAGEAGAAGARGGVHAIPEPVLDAVRRCVSESLAIDPSEVKLESRLIDDLGADSLDFVDIIFMLEHRLEVKMRDTELSFLTRLDFSSPEVMREGFLMPEVTDRLAAWLPAMREIPDRAAVTPAQMFSFITVEAVCLATARRLPAGD